MLVKRRIMTRGRCAAVMTDRFSDKPTNHYTPEDRRNAETDMFFHILADGKDVKIFNDTNMGGMVVEYDDGN